MDANIDNPTFTVVGALYPPMKRAFYLYTGGYALTAGRRSQDCKQLKSPCACLTWLQRRRRHAYQLGRRGRIYSVQPDGSKKFFDEVLHDPKGILSVDASMAVYSMRHIKGPAPYLSLEPVFLANYEKPEQQAACALWSTQDWDHRGFPPVSYTAEESSEFASIMADIDTYADSMSLKFVLGTSFRQWDSYVQTIKNWNIERAIAIQQAAVDRYNASNTLIPYTICCGAVFRTAS
jgi:putative aldouronate transport system substrate-binding protein